MKAFVLPRRGAAAVEPSDVEVPRIGADELLVRVQAIGVGIHDSRFLPGDARYPYPIGIEAAGSIEELGSAVDHHALGDRVAFISSMQPRGGTWAEFAAVSSASTIQPLPAGMDFVQAAAVPVAGTTAVKALSAVGSPPAGGDLFVAGGSGAIGTFAIQLARRQGWRVAASASVDNHGYLRSLGVEETVDYRDPRWRERVMDWMPAGVSAAIAIQPGTTAESLPVVREGASVVSVSGDPLIPGHGVRTTGLPYQLDVREELGALMAHIASSALHLEIERVHPFDEALAALAKVQTRRARGKIVISMNPAVPFG